MMETSTIIILKGSGRTLEAMGGNTLETGETIRWRGMECSPDLMEDITKGSIWMTRNMDSGSSNGQMGGSMKGCDKMGSNMERGLISHRATRGRRMRRR